MWSRGGERRSFPGREGRRTPHYRSRPQRELPDAQASTGPAVRRGRMGAGAPGSVPRRPTRRPRRRDVRGLVSHPAASGHGHASGPHADRAEPVSVSTTQRARLLHPGRAAVSAGAPSHPAPSIHRQPDGAVAGHRPHVGPHLEFATVSREHAPRDRAAGGGQDGVERRHDATPGALPPAVAGRGNATSRRSSTAKRRYTHVLSRVRWPRRSPIVLSDRPDRKRCTAKECRTQWGPWNGMGRPLRFDQAWKASVTAVGLRTPLGVRQRRNSSRQLRGGGPWNGIRCRRTFRAARPVQGGRAVQVRPPVAVHRRRYAESARGAAWTETIAWSVGSMAGFRLHLGRCSECW